MIDIVETKVANKVYLVGDTVRFIKVPPNLNPRIREKINLDKNYRIINVDLDNNRVTVALDHKWKLGIDPDYLELVSRGKGRVY